MSCWSCCGRALPGPSRGCRPASTSALAGELPRVNGWSIARRGGDRTPDRTQRLLNHAVWDTFAAMAVVRRFAVAGLDIPTLLLPTATTPATHSGR
jgi:hypothetical protein